jgi:hypothetical protein
MLAYLTSGSNIDEFHIEPGENSLSLSASTMGAGASCTVAIHDSWPL